MSIDDIIDGGDEMVGVIGNVEGAGPSLAEREMYARASIVSDLLRNNRAAGLYLDAQSLAEQADILWQWVKSGKK